MAMMHFLREGNGSKGIKIFLMTLLVLAVGGLAITDVGGFFRDGVSTNDVARVGDDSISIVTFDNTLRRRLSGAQITPQMAYQYGLTNQILNNEIQTLLIKQAAEDAGIELDHKELARAINEIIASVSTPDEKPSEALTRMLQNWGLSEQRFLSLIERDAKATYMTQLISAGFVDVPEELTQDLYAYENEERDAQIIVFPNKEIKDFEKPTEERILNYYKSNQARFMIPEKRSFQIVKINGKKITDSINIDEAKAKALYDEDVDAFAVPEKRSFAQAIFATEDEAKTAFDLVSNGTSFEEATKGAVSSMEETKMTKADITAGLNDAIFKTDLGKTSAPIKTPLGWHLVKVTSIIKAKTRTFSDVKKDLIDELKAEASADLINALANQVEDALAAGQTPEEIAKTVNVEIEDYVDIPQGEAAQLQKYGEQAQSILGTAFELFENESSTLLETKNGDLQAVYLKKVTPTTAEPFEDVKAEIEKALLEQNQSEANKAYVAELQNALDKDSPSLDKLAKAENKYLQNIKDITRTQKVEKPLNGLAVKQIFGASVGEVFNVYTEDGIALIKVTAARLADPAKAKAEDLKNLEQQVMTGLRQDALTVFVNNEQQKKTVRVNDDRLRSAYGQSEQQ